MAFQSASQQLMVPQNNVGQAFNQGASQADAAMVNDSNLLDAKRRRSMEDIGQLGSIGMALMGGRLDGQVDQQRLAELIPWAQAQGIDVSVLQNRPELIPLITRASLSSMQQIQTAQSEQEIDLRTKELQAQIAQAARGGQPTDDMREYAAAQAQGYTGTFLDYKRDTNPRSMAPMDATTRKELFDAEDAATAGQYVLSSIDRALALNKDAVDGAAAGQRAYIGAMIPDIGIGNANQQDFATLEYQNVTTELALNQLKTIFGGMPTEGERKILIEVQGSVDKPRDVREEILKRARALAERRIEDNRRKADALRSGAYFDQGYGQQMPATGDASPMSPAPSAGQDWVPAEDFFD